MKKKNKKLNINTDAGNVEYNIQSFNNGFAENINTKLDAISDLNRLDEAAGLSRLYSYFKDYDCACISAQQYLPNRNDYQTQAEYEKEFKDRIGKQKKYDDKTLQVELRSKFGGVISIKGFYKYIGEEKADKEKSYFVFNKKELSSDTFKNELMDLAINAKQNSFFYSPKDSFKGYWVYTGIDLSETDGVDRNHKKWDVENVGTIHIGRQYEGEDSTSYSMINGRPFAAFDEDLDSNNIYIDESFGGDIIGNVIYRQEGTYATKIKNMIGK